MAFLELKTYINHIILTKRNSQFLKGLTYSLIGENLCPSLVNQVVGSPL